MVIKEFLLNGAEGDGAEGGQNISPLAILERSSSGGSTVTQMVLVRLCTAMPVPHARERERAGSVKLARLEPLQPLHFAEILRQAEGGLQRWPQSPHRPGAPQHGYAHCPPPPTYNYTPVVKYNYAYTSICHCISLCAGIAKYNPPSAVSKTSPGFDMRRVDGVSVGARR